MIAFGHSEPIMELGNVCFRASRTNYFLLHSTAIEKLYIKYTSKLFCKIISKFSLFSNYCRVIVSPPHRSMAIFSYFVIDISVASQCLLLWYFLSSIGLLSSTSLSSRVIFPWSTLIASNEGYWNVLRRLNPIIRWFVAVSVYEVSNTIASAHMTHNTIEYLFD